MIIQAFDILDLDSFDNEETLEDILYTNKKTEFKDVVIKTIEPAVKEYISTLPWIPNSINQIIKIPTVIQSLVACDPNIYVGIYKVSDTNELYNIIHRLARDVETKINLNWIDISQLSTFKHFNNYANAVFSSSKQIVGLFQGEDLFNKEIDIRHWNTGNIQDFDNLFEDTTFNCDISQWNVSHVTSMRATFKNSLFNGDISAWDVSHVEDMSYMFAQSIFNGDISDWNVSAVCDMSEMFYNSKFNGDINKWNVNSVKKANEMFSCSQFNQDISNWTFGGLKTAQFMFENCKIKEEYLPKQLYNYL